MSRDNTLAKLAAYKTAFPKEASTAQDYIDFILAHTDCFERSLAIGHITGSAWVVDTTGTKVLLTHHKKLNKWFQLGGHADGESDILAVAMKEAREESGIDAIDVVSDAIFDLDCHVIPARKSEAEHHHWDIRFALQVNGNHDYVVSEESHDLSWVPIDQLSDYTQEASMLRMADKWQALRPTAAR